MPKKIIPLFADETPIVEVNYRPRGESTTQTILLSTILERTGMTSWTHSVHSYVKKSTKKKGREPHHLATLVAESHRTETKLALTEMPEGLSGYGVVAIAPIKKGERIIYGSFSLENAGTDKDDPYVAACIMDEKLIGLCTAKDYGNMSRFMGHAPSDIRLAEEVGYTSDDIRDNIAIANFELSKIATSDRDYLALRAIRDISPGEMVLWDYGLDHFRILNILPSLFDKHTHTIIELGKYYWKNIDLHIIVGIDISTSVPLMSVIENNNDVWLDADLIKKNYDVYICSNYFSELLIQQPNLLQRIVPTSITLPEGEHPYIKRIEPGRDLNEFLLTSINHLLGDLSISTWELVGINVPKSAQGISYEASKMAHFRINNEDKTVLESIKERLVDAGIGVRGPIQGRGNYFLCIEKKSLFARIPSAVALSLPPEIVDESIKKSDVLAVSTCSMFSVAEKQSRDTLITATSEAVHKPI